MHKLQGSIKYRWSRIFWVLLGGGMILSSYFSDMAQLILILILWLEFV